MKTGVLVVLILIISWGISAAGTALNDSGSATFIQMEGVPNLYRVSDVLFRSAQPTAEGMKNLNTLGIKTVINLCSGDDPTEILDLGVVYEHIPMQVWNLKQKQAIKFLQILIDNKNTPVLVHCEHGADRTGALCAVYRIAVQEWTKEEALKEMIDGGFGFHQIWSSLIRHWVNELDVEKIRREAGIKKGTRLVGASRRNMQLDDLIPASN